LTDLRVALAPPYFYRLRPSWRELWAAIEADHGDRDWLLVFDRRLFAAGADPLRGLARRRRRHLLRIAGGEAAKSLASFARLQRELAQHRPHRETLVLAVGGGTIGDLVGFVAATHLRGLPWCPVATTSLAMADSALGGKTAVDLGKSKNLVGAFHQPLGVYGCTQALATLPQRHRRAGLAEVVKCAMIADAALFDDLLRLAPKLRRLEDAAWIDVLRRAAAIKIRIVERDPKELGERALLNFGHTVAHALEAQPRARLLHGEAVALGMIAATQLSRLRDLTQVTTLQRLEELLSELQLPLRAPRLELPKLWEAMRYDKKRSADGLRVVLTHGVGSATFGHRVGWPEMRRAVESIRPGARP
jgi:3-dehydroquinate synthase